jgi:hypothetical protein
VHAFGGRRAGIVLALTLLVAGCGESPFGGDEAEAAPVTPAAYAAALAEVDAALKPPFAKLAGDRKGYPVVADSVRAGRQRLATTIPPDAAAAAHDAILVAMNTLAITIEEAGRETPVCPAASPATVVLASTHAAQVRLRAKELAAADPTWVFGKFLPAAPTPQNRRLRNGALVKRPGGGPGEFVVESGKGVGDTAVSLVPLDGKKPAAIIYVREGAKAETDGVPNGKYKVFMASGEDWDAERKGFTRSCGYSKFDDTFDFDGGGVRWTVTLTESVGGNATTSDVKPGEFPAG